MTEQQRKKLDDQISDLVAELGRSKEYGVFYCSTQLGEDTNTHTTFIGNIIHFQQMLYNLFFQDRKFALITLEVVEAFLREDLSETIKKFEDKDE